MHRNRHLAARLQDSLRPSAAVSSFRLRQKLVTCSLSSGDPITALKSLPVTMLIHSYLHMRPQKSEANCPPPPPFPLAASFLFVCSLSPPPLPPVPPLPEIVPSAGGLVRHFQTVKVVQESFLELQLKNVPAESILIVGGETERQAELEADGRVQSLSLEFGSFHTP